MKLLIALAIIFCCLFSSSSAMVYFRILNGFLGPSGGTEPVSYFLDGEQISNKTVYFGNGNSKGERAHYYNTTAGSHQFNITSAADGTNLYSFTGYFEDEEFYSIMVTSFATPDSNDNTEDYTAQIVKDDMGLGNDNMVKVRFINSWIDTRNMSFQLVINGNLTDPEWYWGELATGDYISLELNVSHSFSISPTKNPTLIYFDKRSQIWNTSGAYTYWLFSYAFSSPNYFNGSNFLYSSARMIDGYYAPRAPSAMPPTPEPTVTETPSPTVTTTPPPQTTTSANTNTTPPPTTTAMQNATTVPGKTTKPPSPSKCTSIKGTWKASNATDSVQITFSSDTSGTYIAVTAQKVNESFSCKWNTTGKFLSKVTPGASPNNRSVALYNSTCKADPCAESNCQLYNLIQSEGGEISLEANLEIQNCNVFYNQQGLKFTKTSSAVYISISSFCIVVALFAFLLSSVQM